MSRRRKICWFYYGHSRPPGNWFRYGSRRGVPRWQSVSPWLTEMFERQTYRGGHANSAYAFRRWKPDKKRRHPKRRR